MEKGCRARKKQREASAVERVEEAEQEEERESRGGLSSTGY